MTYEAIIKELKTGKTRPIYFLSGDEPYYIDKLTNYIEKHLLDEAAKAFNQMVLYGKDVDYKMILDEARQFPMMSDKRLIVIREAQDMKTIADLVDYVLKPVPHTILVFVYKHKKLDKRTKFAKAITDNALVFESKALYDDKIASWIQNYAIEIGLNIDAQVAQMIGDFLGTDLAKVSNELDKLRLAFGSGPKINMEDVQEQIGISKEFNVFELQKTLSNRDVVKSNLIIRYFINNPKENPIQVLVANLFGYFMKVMITSQNSTDSDVILQKKLGLSTSYFVKDYRTAAKNYNIAHLRNIIVKIKYIDLQSKGVDNRSIDDGQLLKELIYFILHPSFALSTSN